jgi:SAM-dependent methyltransferase
MPSPFSLVRSVWRALPGRERLVRLPLVQRMMGRAQGFARADDLYDQAYYDSVDSLAEGSMPVIAGTLASEVGPDSVLDVGCGSGALLAALRERGIPGVGLEHSAAGIAASRARGLDVRPADLAGDPPVPPGRFGAVTCLEVAEHLPPHRAEPLVELLTSAADAVLFTAATPGQGGTGHLNEQPHEYWIRRFAARGFALDAGATGRLRAEWQARGVAWWYWRNAMLFRRSG